MGSGKSKLTTNNSNASTKPSLDKLLEIGVENKLPDLVMYHLPEWFTNKDKTFLAAGVNREYSYTVKQETEKAIKIEIKSKKKIHNSWEKWIPKSIIK